MLRQYNCYCLNNALTRGYACHDNVFTNTTENYWLLSLDKLSDHDGLVVVMQCKNISFDTIKDIFHRSTCKTPMLIFPDLNVSLLVDKRNSMDLNYLLHNNFSGAS